MSGKYHWFTTAYSLTIAALLLALAGVWLWPEGPGEPRSAMDTPRAGWHLEYPGGAAMVALPESGQSSQLLPESGRPEPGRHDPCCDRVPPTLLTNHLVPANESLARQSGLAEARTGGFLQLGLSGSGVTVGLWDVGPPRTTHVEFGTRVTYEETDVLSPNKHATNMAGTVMAAGVDAEARGMAPSASLKAWLAGSDREVASMATAAAEGLRIGFHPYTYSAGWLEVAIDADARPDVTWTWAGTTDYSATEDYVFGYYAPRSARWDSLAYAQPELLLVKAAGNQHGFGPATQPVDHWVYNYGTDSWEVSDAVRNLDGDSGGSLSYASLAKNVLTVGSAGLTGTAYEGPGSVTLSPTSGRGPADDGRVKPELVALSGVEVTPGAAADTDYTTAGGTSSAAAVAAGTAALVQELYQRHWSRAPLASTYKALFIHTARPAGGTDGPDYDYGFGLLDGGGALRYLEAAGRGAGQVLHVEGTVPNGGTRSYTLHADGRSPLHVTLAWTDPPGTPLTSDSPSVLNNRTPVLEHDLDVRVTGPDGVTRLPWVLDPDAPSAGASRGDNVVDPVEMVVVDAPPAGTYTVTVQHKGTLPAEGQSFSLFAGPAELHLRRFTLAEAGWRVISAPYTDLPYASLNPYFFTQGGPDATWSTYTGTTSNLWQFDAATATYEPVPASGGTFQAGRGYLFYIYPDNPSGLPERTWLPGTWFTHGAPAGNTDIDLSGVTDWYLAGNPYEATLDWAQTYTASAGVRPGIALWNPDASTASGTAGDTSGFVYFSAELDLGDGPAHIAPFSGFFMQREAGADPATLRFRRDQLLQGATPPLFGKHREPAPFATITVRQPSTAPGEAPPPSTTLKFIADDRAHTGYDLLDIDRAATLAVNAPELSSRLIIHNESPRTTADERHLAWDVRPPADFEQGTRAQLKLCGISGDAPAEISLGGSMPVTLTLWDAGNNEHQLAPDAALVLDSALLRPDADGCAVIDVRLKTRTTLTSTETMQDSAMPNQTRLLSSYPNPFNATTRIRVGLDQPTTLQLQVIVVLGRPVSILASGDFPAGEHTFRLDAAHLPSGVYLVQLTTPSERIHQQITLIK